MWRVYLDKGDYRQSLVHCRRWGGQGAVVGVRAGAQVHWGALTALLGHKTSVAASSLSGACPATCERFLQAWPAGSAADDADAWHTRTIRCHSPTYVACYCSAAQRNSVYLVEAASLFEEGEYVQAAALYGKVRDWAGCDFAAPRAAWRRSVRDCSVDRSMLHCSLPRPVLTPRPHIAVLPLLQVTSATPSFEEVALRLMETGEPEAIAALLQTRLDTLGREDKAQVGCWPQLSTCMAGKGREWLDKHMLIACPSPLQCSHLSYQPRSAPYPIAGHHGCHLAHRAAA